MRDEIARLSYKSKPTEIKKEEAFLKQYALPIAIKKEGVINGQGTRKL